MVFINVTWLLLKKKFKLGASGAQIHDNVGQHIVGMAKYDSTVAKDAQYGQSGKGLGGHCAHDVAAVESITPRARGFRLASSGSMRAARGPCWTSRRA